MSSITDELRNFANIGMSAMECAAYSDKLIAIADRIDAAVEGMVEMPRDADNVPWNPGDRDKDGNKVIGLVLTSNGWHVITDGPWPYRPERESHYHALTVEDVLREFADGWDFAEGVGKGDSYMKTFAAKLRLAEGAN